MDDFGDDQLIKEDVFEKLIDRSQIEKMEHNRLLRS
jgi:hypothetical protein